MVITKDKLAALIVFAVIEVAAQVFLRSVGMPGIGLLVTLVFATFGLSLIWFAEPLGEIACFSRGVAHTSPPAMIELLGWILLVGYPAFLVCVMRWPGALGV